MGTLTKWGDNGRRLPSFVRQSLDGPPGPDPKTNGFLKAAGTAVMIYQGARIIDSLANAFQGSMNGEPPDKVVAPQLATDRAVPVVYGYKKIGGQILYRQNTNEATFNLAVGLCEGEIEEISRIQVDGRNIEELGESSYTAYMGTADQETDSRLTAGNTSIPCIADAYIVDDQPDLVCNWDFLRVKSGSPQARIYFKFDLSDFPAGLSITGARIRLAQRAVTSGQYQEARKIKVKSIASETWSEETLTWNNAPAPMADFATQWKIRPAAGGLCDITLNAAGAAGVRKAYKDGATLSFVIEAEETLEFLFESKESAKDGPLLFVEYDSSTGNAFRNTAYLAMTIDNREGLVSAYPLVTAYVKGCKVKAYDGGAWGADAYSQNPAWIIYDIMTRHRRGMGALFDPGKLDAASFKAVADKCDELVTRPDGTTEKRYLCDVAFVSRSTAWQAIQEICAATGIYFQEHDGKIFLAIEKNGAADHTLTEDDFIPGSFSYSVGDPNDISNVLRVSYMDPAEDFKETWVQAESEQDIVSYGMKVSELRLTTVNRRTEAARFAHWQLWRGLLARRTFTGRLSIKHSDMIAGDIVAVTHALPGWSGKLFRVVDVREDSADELEISCQEYVERTAALDTCLPNAAYVETTGGGKVTAGAVPDPPTWTVQGVQGGWLFTITGPVSGAIGYSIYMFNEDRQDFTDLAGYIKDSRTDAAQNGTRLTATIDATRYGKRVTARFKLRTWTKTSQSALSEEQSARSLVKNAPDWVPSAPSLSDDGYPLLSKIAKYNAFTFMVRNKILAFGDEKDAVRSYEIQRRDDVGSGEVTWSTWATLPEKVIQDPSTPNPLFMYYDNTDHLFVAGRVYQYRVRAVGLNGKPSAWSDPVRIEMEDDTTPPDKPVFTATELTGAVRLDIQAATQGGGPCPDFAYWKIEKSDDSGATWATLQARHTGTVFIDVDIDANLETNRRYRITAYDYSNNASTVADPSTDKKKKKVSSTTLADGAVTPLKANLSLQGWQITTVWTSADYRKVQWGAGTLFTGDGTTYSIGAGNTGNMTAGYEHFIYFDVAVSTTALQVTTTAANAVGSGKILVGVAYPNGDSAGKASFQMFGGVGKSMQIVTADWLAANSVTAGKVLANSLTGAEFAATMAIVCGTGDDVAGFTGADSIYRLYVGDSTPADAPFRVTKGGALTATAANIKTATGNERIEMVTSGGVSTLALYVGGVLNAKMGQIDLGGNSLGYFYVSGEDHLEGGGTYNCSFSGWGMIPSADWCMGLPTGSGKFYDLSVPRIYFDTSSKALKVDYSGSTYTYSKD